MAVRLLNISFMEGSSSQDVQSDSLSEGAIDETVFLTALHFMVDLVIALCFLRHVLIRHSGVVNKSSIEELDIAVKITHKIVQKHSVD